MHYNCPHITSPLYTYIAIEGCQEDYWDQGKVSKWGPTYVVAIFVNLLCMDFNVEPSLSSYILSAMPVEQLIQISLWHTYDPCTCESDAEVMLSICKL